MHRARNVQSFRMSQRHSVVVRCVVVGCLQLHITSYHLLLHVVGLMVMFVVPRHRFTVSLSRVIA